jgi:hypothetical protein
MSRIEHHHRPSVFRQVGVHGMDKADVVDQLGYVWKNLTNVLAALSVLPKRVR